MWAGEKRQPAGRGNQPSTQSDDTQTQQYPLTTIQPVTPPTISAPGLCLDLLAAARVPPTKSHGEVGRGQWHLPRAR